MSQWISGATINRLVGERVTGIEALGLPLSKHRDAVPARQHPELGRELNAGSLGWQQVCQEARAHRDLYDLDRQFASVLSELAPGRIPDDAPRFLPHRTPRQRTRPRAETTPAHRVATG